MLVFNLIFELYCRAQNVFWCDHIVTLGHGGQKIVICYTFFKAMYVFMFCLMDIVNILINNEQEDLDVNGIYITLTPVNMDSDSASENEGRTIDNLTGRLLRAGAEIAITDWQRISNEKELREAANPAPILNQPNRSIN